MKNRIFLINKKSIQTNSEIIKKLKIKLKIKKLSLISGLDFFSSGLVVAAENNAIKLNTFFQDYWSEYEVSFTINKKSLTWDNLGEIIEDNLPLSNITKDHINKIITLFPKKYLQKYPPKMVIKIINNKKQYINLNKLPTTISIKSLKLISFKGKSGVIKVITEKISNPRSLIHNIFDKHNLNVITTKIKRIKYGDLLYCEKEVEFKEIPEVVHVETKILSKTKYKHSLSGSNLIFISNSSFIITKYNLSNIALYYKLFPNVYKIKFWINK